MIAKTIANVPNVLTILRFVFSPVFFYFFMSGKTELGLVVFMFVAVTDLADGWIAREYKATTGFGKAIDPMADKFMIFFGIWSIISMFDFPLWALPLYILRDFVSLGGSLLVHIKHRGIWKPNTLGKLTTGFQVATIISYIIDVQLKFALLIITLILSILTSITYIGRIVKIFKGTYKE